MMAKTKNRARIITSGNAALLTWTEMYRLRKVSPSSTTALQKPMSRDIIKTSSTKSFLPIRNTSFLRKSKLQRGLSIASRFNIRHSHRHVVACRQQQGASNMIRQSTARGSQGAKEPIARGSQGAKEPVAGQVSSCPGEEICSGHIDDHQTQLLTQLLNTTQLLLKCA